jgi:hypothetical protein
MMFQDEGGRSATLNKSYLYLDTCSTEDLMIVLHYLNPLTLHTNVGVSQTDQKGHFGGTAFWLDEKDIGNVISLKTLESKFHVTYNTEASGGAFMCHTPKGKVVFNRCPVTTFPYVDLNQDSTGAEAMMVQRVCKNNEGYTREEVERAIMARKMQARRGHPSKAAFKQEVS